MKQYMKCNVCGFIGEEGRIKEACPACGAPVAAFASYSHGISEKRLKRLNMHLHPILVHFPQSIALLSFIFIGIAFLTNGGISRDLILIEKVLSIILPFTIIAAMSAGAFDAKTRLKTSIGRIRKQKIQLGSFFLVSSGITAVLINYEVFNSIGKIAIMALSFFSIVCSALLGKKGSSLLDVKIKDQL